MISQPFCVPLSDGPYLFPSWHQDIFSIQHLAATAFISRLPLTAPLFPLPDLSLPSIFL